MMTMRKNAYSMKRCRIICVTALSGNYIYHVRTSIPVF